MSLPLVELARRAGEGRAPAVRAALHESGPTLVRFLELLLDAAATMNLLSRSAREPEELVNRHLLDALDGLPFLPVNRAGERIDFLDVGSGGGLPAIPLLIARSDLRGVLVESTGKKARFLEQVIGVLGLTAEVVNARFPGPIPQMKERFQFLTTRAVANAGTIVRDAGPSIAKGGVALLWTTESLVGEAIAGSGFHRKLFHSSPGAETRGILVLERST